MSKSIACHRPPHRTSSSPRSDTTRAVAYIFAYLQWLQDPGNFMLSVIYDYVIVRWCVSVRVGGERRGWGAKGWCVRREWTATRSALRVQRHVCNLWTWLAGYSLHSNHPRPAPGNRPPTSAAGHRPAFYWHWRNRNEWYCRNTKNTGI